MVVPGLRAKQAVQVAPVHAEHQSSPVAVWHLQMAKQRGAAQVSTGVAARMYPRQQGRPGTGIQAAPAEQL